MKEGIDTGGSNAIKGFNYQKSLISLIAILNHDKKDLSIFVETEDDVVVLISGIKVFVQAKSSNELSIAKLIKPGKSSSIIKKNISKGDDNSRFKIAIPNACFSKSDKKSPDSLILEQGLIFDNVYKYSDSQKNKIIDALEKEGVDKDVALRRISNSFIYISDFDSNQERAIKYLIGEMCSHGISVDNGAGMRILSTLFTEIDIRGGHIQGKDVVSDAEKELSCYFLNKIFCKGESIALEKEIMDTVAGGDFRFRRAIYKERYSSRHEHLENTLRELYGRFDKTGDTKDVVLRLVDIAGEAQVVESQEALYAITIKIVAEAIINDN